MVNIHKRQSYICNNKYMNINICTTNYFTIQGLKRKQQILLASITGQGILI